MILRGNCEKKYDAHNWDTSIHKLTDTDKLQIKIFKTHQTLRKVQL